MAFGDPKAMEAGVEEPAPARRGRRPCCCGTVVRVIFCGCLGMALYGYDTAVVSGAMVLVRKDIALDTAETQTVVSVTLLFAALSTVLGIPLNSMYGRRPVIMAAALLFAAGSVAIAMSEGLLTLVMGRALLGVSIGFTSGTVPMYSAELAPPSIRGTVLTLNDLNIVFGQMVAGLVNVCFRDVEGGWRWSMGIAAAPATLMLFGFLLLPESPRWLASKGRLEDAAKVLRMTHGTDDVGEALKDILAALDREGGREDTKAGCLGVARGCLGKVVVLWRGKESRRAAVLGIGLMMMNQLTGINTVMYYSATILFEAGFTATASLWLAALCCAAQLVGVCVSAASMDSAGRRATGLRSCVGVSLALFLLAAAFQQRGAAWDAVKVMALMAYLIAFGSGLSAVPWVVNAEIYPSGLRAAGLGQAVFVKWVLNWGVGRYFLSLCEALGTGGAFGTFAVFSVAGGAWMFFALPETMGLELEAVSALFQDPYPKASYKGRRGAAAAGGGPSAAASDEEGNSTEATTGSETETGAE